VINAVGLIKQLAGANDALAAIPINSVLPHRLARLCDLVGARLIHISTDCVFSGRKGMYKETDDPDANDLYGRSKFLGEVAYPNTVTLRTSIIGHELSTAHGLVGWFLAQDGTANGYSRAVFSGLSTVELARIIRDYVIPQPELVGLYHVSSDPINKLDLLRLVAKVYGKTIEIIPSEKVVIDRSLDSTRFRQITGYHPPPWDQLVTAMRDFG
jgi:dTDP-4-dehydrorhamnose reductase